MGTARTWLYLFVGTLILFALMNVSSSPASTKSLRTLTPQTPAPVKPTPEPLTPEPPTPEPPTPEPATPEPPTPEPPTPEPPTPEPPTPEPATPEPPTPEPPTPEPPTPEPKPPTEAAHTPEPPTPEPPTPVPPTPEPTPSPPLEDGQELGALYSKGYVMPKGLVFREMQRLLEAAGETLPGGVTRSRTDFWKKNFATHVYPNHTYAFGTYVQTFQCANGDFVRNLAKKMWKHLDADAPTGPTGQTAPRCSKAGLVKGQKETFASRRWTFVRDPLKRFVAGYTEIQDRVEVLRKEPRAVEGALAETVDENCKKFRGQEVEAIVDDYENHLRHGPNSLARAKEYIAEIVSGKIALLHGWWSECVELEQYLYSMDDGCARTVGYDFVGKLERFETDVLKLREWGHVDGDYAAAQWEQVAGGADRVTGSTNAMKELLSDKTSPYFNVVCTFLYNDHVRFQYPLPDGCGKVQVSWANPAGEGGTGHLNCGTGVCTLPPVKPGDEAADDADFSIVAEATPAPPTPAPPTAPPAPSLSAPLGSLPALTGKVHKMRDVYRHGYSMPKKMMFEEMERMLTEGGVELPSMPEGEWIRPRWLPADQTDFPKYWKVKFAKHVYPNLTTPFGTYVRSFKCANDDFTHNLLNVKVWQSVDPRVDTKPTGEIIDQCSEKGRNKGEESLKTRRWTFVRDPLRRFVSGYTEIQDRAEVLKEELGTVDITQDTFSWEIEKMCTKFRGKDFKDGIQKYKSHLRHPPNSLERAQDYIAEIVTGKISLLSGWFTECVGLESHLYNMDDGCARTVGYDFVGKLEKFDKDLQLLREWGQVEGEFKLSNWERPKGGGGNRIKDGTLAMKKVLADKDGPYFKIVCILLYNENVRFQYPLPEGCGDIELQWDNPSVNGGTGHLDCSSGVCVLPPLQVRESAYKDRAVLNDFSIFPRN